MQNSKQNKQLAIIGNGPARDLYGTFEGDICVCNVPQIEIDYDYISVIDRKCVDYYIAKNIHLEKPIYTLEVMHNVFKKHGFKNSEPKFKEKLMNSAATAAYYFADHYDTIWLYGCDSLWSSEVKSYQDTLIPRPTRPSNLHLQWRKHWQRVWEKGNNFFIVHPEGVKPEDYGENVCWYSIRKSD